ncbi:MULTISPECIES: FAD-binding oxidoreductase [unclassified Aureispira]|uniref:NAD(P)/FAD-dependent oxidoreductase n=1 Tax=unclassified Aureispira TaxID=2649989 RepID=UPI0006960119|nr:MULTISPECIES: FAD-binding oxidoreductase [unclassified Aureispira]WMX13699.1 FAD-binding oxidoreductase [Aureispira sp. CCB-E]
MYDYIIVGQGIAGTLVAHFLLKQGKKILVIDHKHHQAASMVAAGLINPITGRNFVKSWRIDDLIPFAITTYRALEQQLDIPILELKQVAMLFNSIKTENDWLVRSSNPDIADYVTNGFRLDFYKNFLTDIQNGVEFQQAGRVRLKDLVLAYQTLLQKEQSYLEEQFDYASLVIEQNQVSYKDMVAKRIIFAEGFQAIQNPYFNYLPFAPAKGDILLVKIPNYPAPNKLVKHGVFIIHLKEDLYWIGSTYNRDYKTISPLPKAKKSLIERLERILKLPFEVVEHIAAVRPTVRDRRPFIGQHPHFKALYLFNGMGAKGSYLSPLFAAEFVAYLEGEKSLDAEVDIARYYRYYEEAQP